MYFFVVVVLFSLICYFIWLVVCVFFFDKKNDILSCFCKLVSSPPHFFHYTIFFTFLRNDVFQTLFLSRELDCCRTQVVMKRVFPSLHY